MAQRVAFGTSWFKSDNVLQWSQNRWPRCNGSERQPLYRAKDGLAGSRIRAFELTLLLGGSNPLGTPTRRLRILETSHHFEMNTMTDAEFLDQAERLLKDLESVCDRLNDEEPVDIDNQRVGSMVTLVFPNASQIVVNLQKPLHEVWLASRSGGYHFKFVEGAWMDTKGQGEFWTQLFTDMNAQTGLALKIQKP